MVCNILRHDHGSIALKFREEQYLGLCLSRADFGYKACTVVLEEMSTQKNPFMVFQL